MPAISDGVNKVVVRNDSAKFIGFRTATAGIGSDANVGANVNSLPRGRRSLDDPALLKLGEEQTPTPTQTAFLAAPAGRESGLPTSGSEPKYDPSQWNDPLFRLGNNCYAYACNDLNEYRLGSRDFPQPGVTGGIRPPMAFDYTVGKLRERAIADGLTPAEAGQEKQPAPLGFYKTALFVQAGVDYHWYRQDPDGHWSHKLANGLVAKTDASGNTINDPRTADRNYEHIPNLTTGQPIGYNYTQFAGFFYVPEGGLRLITLRPIREWAMNFPPPPPPPPHSRPRAGPGRR